MDVRCERCNAQYAVDDGLVHEGGLAVRCAMCGHSFKAMKAQGRSLRKTSGDVYTLPDSATLQRWVVEGRVTREDEIAEPGQPWVKAGQLKDLEPFFSVVDQARRARSGAHASSEPRPGPEGARDARTPTGELILGSPVAPSNESWQAPAATGIQSDEPAWAVGPVTARGQAPVQRVHVEPKKGRDESKGRQWTLLLFLFVVLVILGLAMGATFYVLKPDMVPAELSKFIRDWNTWTAGSEKLSTDGAARALAPAAPGARPGGDTSKPPAPLLPLAPVIPVPPAPPPPRAPQAQSAEGAAGAESPGAAAPAAGPVNPAPATTTTPSGQLAKTQGQATDGEPGGPGADTGVAAAAKPATGETAAAKPTEAPPPAASASPAAPETRTPGTPPPAAPAAPRATAAAAPRSAAVAPVEKKAPAAPGPKSVTSLLAQARQLRDSGRASQALDTYGRALQVNPKSADAQAGRGLAYLDLSQYRQAEESFKEALELDPSHSSALMGLAETYRYQGKRSDAVVLYQKYLASHPKGEDATAARKAIQALEESP